MASGMVCVTPRKLPAKIIVPPNSPKARAHAIWVSTSELLAKLVVTSIPWFCSSNELSSSPNASVSEDTASTVRVEPFSSCCPRLPHRIPRGLRTRGTPATNQKPVRERTRPMPHTHRFPS